MENIYTKLDTALIIINYYFPEIDTNKHKQNMYFLVTVYCLNVMLGKHIVVHL